ncbi:MAG: flagellar hook-basal body complex protein FliE [Deltaproteobacteria bacterium]|nr:MAG: flagellar hook-basal body complex protein FliE [Deltaproteobacteria bacterium]
MSRIDLETGLYTRPTTPRIEPRATAEAKEADFGDALLDALAHADRIARSADQASEGLVRGTVSIHDAMIAMEKANLVLQFGTTVRNKLLEAYREIMNAAA